MKLLASLLYTLLASLLVGCAAPTGLVHPQQGVVDVRPSPGKATVVVVRERMLKGAIGNWSVSLDGREVSRLSVGNYLVKEVEPGEHSLSNVAWVGSPTLFTAEAGRVYYFNYDLSLLGGNSFEQMSETEARDRMSRYTRIRVLF